ncbi:hypothetical protein SAMN03159338_4276 [Sphingomonas sp. NFR04]|uniref:hypothetical protein n=1 Tax=Sphingomonas sp. NFR04 TaxID=1566283 RepID=UPI0008E49CF5|nr:hypothetical protein [Sphingomonas sp. NFR04]SFK44608.1 hypothetical protein SAMN03159338_4276 [Sphingomonas sp. NFR04]
MSNKKGVAKQDFNDVGTGKHFEAGKAPNCTAGEYENYRAAGLIEEPGQADNTDTKGGKTAD